MLEAKWKCYCMRKEATLYLRDRKPAEDIADYMSHVSIEVSKEHVKFFPTCKSSKLEYLKLPLADDSRGIGYPKGSPNA